MQQAVYPVLRYLDLHPTDTQAAIAKRAGCSPQKLNDLIAGRWRRPSPELAMSLSKAMSGEVSVDELLFFRPAPRKKRRVRRANGHNRKNGS